MENSLSEKYQKVLGTQEFEEDLLFTNRYDFDLALSDLNACLSCKGTCKTAVNKIVYVDPSGKAHDDYDEKVKGFVALHHYDSKRMEMPMFRFFFCPGVVQRKEELKRWLFRK